MFAKRKKSENEITIDCKKTQAYMLSVKFISTDLSIQTRETE